MSFFRPNSKEIPISSNGKGKNEEELSDYELLQKILVKIELIEERQQKELEAIKLDMARRTDFLQEMLIKCIDNAKTAATKPSVLEAYQTRKAEEAAAEVAKAKLSNKAIRLPG